METRYIMAIVALGMFFVMFVLFAVHYVRSKKSEEEQTEYLEKMYADKNLVKMEYDIAFYEVKPDNCFSAMFGENGNLIQTESDEGMEEIVGNFKGK